MNRTAWTRFATVVTLSAGMGTTVPAPAVAQSARISEEVRTLETYPFSEPNPVPILVRDTRLYPYHSFEGYSTTSSPREWKVIRLENDLIEVFVLPEVGGKVWGAVVKATGHEFIYRNEVMKFRNIALRGPWTSGGIEFNFGVIGHTPATATPVDYTMRENEDGSVSAIVGSMDLPSRTHWRVEIRLRPDRAYFETHVLWYNPTPLEQPYYNWMTGAAFARSDLLLSVPGNAYLDHPGNEHAWPNDDQGRYLPQYRNNTFGPAKSYHVVGELNDFFGGYYQEAGYGFGHWARHEDLPGQKIWLWALSREGGVWEDLLTDTDGQYVEFQAGRLLVQFSPDASANPIKQASFDPMSASRWTETWFPVEGIGGLTDVSMEGAMHVSLDGGDLTVAVNAFGSLSDTLQIWSGGRLVERRAVRFEPLEPFTATVAVTPAAGYRVRLQRLGLDYSSDPATRALSRPLATDAAAMPSLPATYRTVFEAKELTKARRYPEARALFETALEREPWNRDALVGLAELEFRRDRLGAASSLVRRALQLDAYDAGANFLAGVVYRALGQHNDARDAFGWAARSTGLRSAAYTQLAEMGTGPDSEDFAEAARYARLAIDFDRHGIGAWQALAVVGRRTGDGALVAEALGELEATDPLHHFVWSERWLASPTMTNEAALRDRLGGEFPDQTLLELAIGYAGRGLTEDAIALLDSNTGEVSAPVRRAWRAYLRRDPGLLRGPIDVAFQFPFRRESLAVLEWARANDPAWEWSWLRGLSLWAIDRTDEAAAALQELGDRPTFGPAYAARGLMLERERGTEPTPDLERAVALEPSSRLLHVALIQHLEGAERWPEAVTAAGAARERFATDFNLQLLEARALIHVGRAADAVTLLDRAHVLPSESARESHRLYEQAHTLVGLDHLEAGRFDDARRHFLAALEWPESLGQGRPYDPEERVARLLLGHAVSRLGDRAAATDAYAAVVDATAATGSPARSRVDLTAFPALVALGRSAEAATLAAPSGWGGNAAAGRFITRWAEAVGGGASAASARSLAAASATLFEGLDGQILLRAISFDPGINR